MGDDWAGWLTVAMLMALFVVVAGLPLRVIWIDRHMLFSHRLPPQDTALPLRLQVLLMTRTVEEQAETLVALQHELARLGDEARRWQALGDTLEARAAALRTRPSTGADERFRRAKQRFARLYHPDAGRGEERLSRAALFREYWAELEAIDGGRDSSAAA